jgi:hypothetical protein
MVSYSLTCKGRFIQRFPRNIPQVALCCYFKSRCRDVGLNRVLAPEGEILSLRKPSLVFALRASRWLFKFAPGEFVAFTGGCQKGPLALWQRAASLPRPCGCYACKSAVLPICPGESSGVRRGKRDPVRATISFYCSTDRV